MGGGGWWGWELLKNELSGALGRKSISLKYCRKAHTHVWKSDVVGTDARSRGDHQLCDRHSLYYEKTILSFFLQFLPNLVLLVLVLLFFHVKHKMSTFSVY